MYRIVAIAGLSYFAWSCSHVSQRSEFGAIQITPTLQLNDPQSMWVGLEWVSPATSNDSLQAFLRTGTRFQLEYPFKIDSLRPGGYDLVFGFCYPQSSSSDSSQQVFDTIGGRRYRRINISPQDELRELRPTAVRNIRVGIDSISVVAGNLIRPHWVWSGEIGFDWELSWDGRIMPMTR